MYKVNNEAITKQLKVAKSEEIRLTRRPIFLIQNWQYRAKHSKLSGYSNLISSAYQGTNPQLEVIVECRAVRFAR